MRLSDLIEDFIKEMFVESEDNIELQRNELAEYFRCAPSQINYVLSTRFTPNHGYVIRSRRGGGGCIQIYKINETDSEISYFIKNYDHDKLTEIESEKMLQYLLSRSIINEREYRIIRRIVSKKTLILPLDQENKDILRAKIFKEILLELSLDMDKEEE